MVSRLELHEKFCKILGSRNVYYQPPSAMNYPAIKYELDGYTKVYANARVYRIVPSYKVTLIDYNPDSPFVEKILELPYCRFDRAYPADGLNHFVFKISI